MQKRMAQRIVSSWQERHAIFVIVGLLYGCYEDAMVKTVDNMKL